MAEASDQGSLLVTQVHSGIGSKPKHRATLRALGLGKIGRSRTVADRPEIRGMLSSIAHLVTVEATKSTHKRAPAASEKEAG
jgi:large subunit ribosomal protein L30